MVPSNSLNRPDAIIEESGRRNSVLIDITTVIGAEDFIRSANAKKATSDPFARQCFVEVVQSLIFMSQVYVAHPSPDLSCAQQSGR
jgi:hypothetical protein